MSRNILQVGFWKLSFIDCFLKTRKNFDNMRFIYRFTKVAKAKFHRLYLSI